MPTLKSGMVFLSIIISFLSGKTLNPEVPLKILKISTSEEIMSEVRKWFGEYATSSPRRLQSPSRMQLS